jgi:hypothetical protein
VDEIADQDGHCLDFVTRGSLPVLTLRKSCNGTTVSSSKRRADLDAILRQSVFRRKLAGIVDEHVQMAEALLKLRGKAVH